MLVDLANNTKTITFDIWPVIFLPPFKIICLARERKTQQIWNTDIHAVITSMRMSVILPNITYIVRMEMIQLDGQMTTIFFKLGDT